MKHLDPSEFPKDFYYHRTSSPLYRRYLESCWPKTFDIGNPPQYAWKKSLFWGNFHIIRYERTDVEPNIEKLKKEEGIKHAMIAWIPYSQVWKPTWWRSLWASDHFQETGTNILDEIPYYQKWNDRARRARKKFLSSGAEVRSVTRDEFIEAFSHTRVKHWYRSDYIRNYKRFEAIDPSKIRQWLVYKDAKPVAGLAVLDYLDDHSVHFVSFTGKDSYDVQWGTGLIDEWFADSVKKWIKYISFDHLRNPHGPSDQKGYTAFKENFIEFRMSFPKAYFKMF
jgi:hypothetical protein